MAAEVLMHDPILNQGQWLRQVVTGFFAYHAVPTNLDAPAAFRYHIMVLWMRMLTRRSQKDRAGWDRPQGVAGLLRAAWLRPKQTDLVPGKGQFRSRSPIRSAIVVRQRFFWIRNRHRHHLSATLLDGRAGNGWARLSRCGRDRSDGGFPNAGYEPASVMRRLSLNRPAAGQKERPKYPEKSLPDNNS